MTRPQLQGHYLTSYRGDWSLCDIILLCVRVCACVYILLLVYSKEQHTLIQVCIGIKDKHEDVVK